MKNRTVADLIEISKGHLLVDMSPGVTLDTALTELRFLVWNAHHRPVLSNPAFPTHDVSFLDPALQAFYLTPAGRALWQVGDVRGDTGAYEIGLECIRRSPIALNMPGIMLSPRWGGRGCVDMNRPVGSEIVFPVPRHLHALFQSAYKLAMDPLTMLVRDFPNFQFFLQVHTMGAGNFTADMVKEADLLEAELTRLVAIESMSEADMRAYEQAALAFAAESARFYNIGSNDPSVRRPDIDILCNTPVPDAAPTPLVDGGFSPQLMEFLRLAGIIGQFDKPFPLIGGYPCTDLARIFEQHGPGRIQGVFDLSKRILMADPNAPFDVLAFRPDAIRVALVAEAIMQAGSASIGR